LAFINVGMQAQEYFVRKGLLSARATISTNYLSSLQESYHSIHGNIEAYVSDKISLSGEGYYSFTDNTLLEFNHKGFFGANYHFFNKNNDWYIGIQPGLAYTKMRQAINTPNMQAGLNPVFSATLGYNLYFFKYFHFFVQSRLILGEHHYYPTFNVNELCLSAGLGFNINTIK